ncbi:hypothetical protein CEK26_009574 [Fusarium fujikuroi]|uniref:Uncharacterized protein n=1 Tax=Fusarium fujikuroi TaxID=5127 RepID=A0A2H3S0G1_FUSFU|nr:Uncharacterized protein Y057_10832 [Fusarium fujikuroi]KLP21056.1 Uncharacterized protein LW94_13862 [Fusarium fujikuroi]QGI65624.1 hypothetical protein CEK27_009595 [Fusarium fujikuroi]QGI82872.1 hypothetical protein CEK25_009601 [Fusarium fujikuroi]QGI96505.1 hypothetical protein CEK26_009574 [Fusarium fujikuroi]
MSDPTPDGIYPPAPPELDEEFNNAIKLAVQVGVHNALSGLEERLANAIATEVATQLKKVIQIPQDS